MPLAQRAASRPHSIRAFRAVALARFQEAQHLAVAERRLAAIYLFGYCAEMLLKAASFRVMGWVLDQPITLGDLQRAKARALHLGCLWPGNLHYLPGWQHLLIEERQVRALPYPAHLRRAFNANVTRLALNWSESLRYHDMRPYRGEADAVFQATCWLMDHFRQL